DLHAHGHAWLHVGLNLLNNVRPGLSKLLALLFLAAGFLRLPLRRFLLQFHLAAADDMFHLGLDAGCYDHNSSSAAFGGSLAGAWLVAGTGCGWPGRLSQPSLLSDQIFLYFSGSSTSALMMMAICASVSCAGSSCTTVPATLAASAVR